MLYTGYMRPYEWLITLLLILTTILAVLKLDNVITTSWAVVFVPFYFIVLHAIWTPLVYDTASAMYDEDFEETLSPQERRCCSPVFYYMLYIVPLGRSSDWTIRFLAYTAVGSLSSFLVLGFIKIISDDLFEWWAVFIPLMFECLVVTVALISGCGRDFITNDDHWIDRAIPCFLTVILLLFFIFMFLKLDQLVDWSWYVVMIPYFVLKAALVICPVILSGISFWASYSVRSYTRWSQDSGMFCLISTILSVLVYAPLMVFVVLAIQKAEGDNNLTYALIFTPLFILEGCGCIGCIIMNGIATASDDD